MDILMSFFAMPIGLLLFFGPVLAAWVLAEIKSPKKDSNDGGISSTK